MGILIGNTNGGNLSRGIFARSSIAGNAKGGSQVRHTGNDWCIRVASRDVGRSWRDVGRSHYDCGRRGFVEIRRCGATATAATTTATRATAERLNNTGRSPRIRVQ